MFSGFWMWILVGAWTAPVSKSHFLIAYENMPTDLLPSSTCYDFHNTTFTICLTSALPQSFTGVLAVDEDMEIKLQMCQQQAPWHLSRIVQKQGFQMDGIYRYPAKTTANAGVYVVDTFIDIQHPEF